jgi:hemerythrin-like domain-containing protein
MEATEIMMAEHQVILRGIDALVAFSEEVRRGGGSREELSRFVTFIRGYADALHHGKEEDFLFTAMVDAGFPREGGPIAVMLSEHDVGREYVGTLAALAETRVPWSDGDREALADAARGYAELLRAHIHKEDAILYPMAEQRLPAALKARVDAQCAEFEAAARADGRRETLERLANDLVSRHLPGLAEGLGA